MAFSASWIAMWVIAYIRDSCSGLSVGAIHAASAASPAFAFQMVTGFGFATACGGCGVQDKRRGDEVRRGRAVACASRSWFRPPPVLTAATGMLRRHRRHC